VNLDNLTAATDLHFPFKAFRELGVTVCLASYMNSVQPKGKGGKDYTRPHVRVGARLPYGGRRNSGWFDSILHPLPVSTLAVWSANQRL